MSLSQIDISKINENGKYINFETMEMYTLTDDEILALRKYYQDETIASQRIISRRINTTELELPKARYQPKHLGASTKPTYKLTRDQTYNRGRHHTKKNPHHFPGKLIIIGGLVISLVCGTKIYQIINHQNDLPGNLSNFVTFFTGSEDYDRETTPYKYNLPKNSVNGNLDKQELEDEEQIENSPSNQTPSSNQEVPTNHDPITNQESNTNQEQTPNQEPTTTQDTTVNQEPTTTQDTTTNQEHTVEDENVTDTSSNGEDVEQPTYEQERKDLIKNLCDIYQVDFNIIYNQIVKLSDNFTSTDYLNGTLEGVTCKGQAVQANSEEELLVYIVRCMKQLPSTFGLSNDIYINNGYVSSTDYCAIINRVSNTLGLDRCLVYAIVRSECSFDSPMFNEINNPAGLRNKGQWWAFDTKEEGFFELGMELLKYYRLIGETPDQIDFETIVKIRDIHAPLSDGNELWLPNVLSNLEYAQLHEAELFPTNEPTNGLSK